MSHMYYRLRSIVIFFLEEKPLTEKSVTKVCLNFPRTIDYLIKYIKDLKSV